MKKTILIATAAIMALSGFAATAQPRPYGDRDRDGVPNYADNHNNNRGGGQRWAKGQRYDHYRDRSYQVNDWRARHYRAPPRGYAYYRTDSGDVVMAAIASGVIASVIANGGR
jgi:Ni/Co efflux regulator RcnB